MKWPTDRRRSNRSSTFAGSLFITGINLDFPHLLSATLTPEFSFATFPQPTNVPFLDFNRTFPSSCFRSTLNPRELQDFPCGPLRSLVKLSHNRKQNKADRGEPALAQYFAS